MNEGGLSEIELSEIELSEIDLSSVVRQGEKCPEPESSARVQR